MDNTSKLAAPTPAEIAKWLKTWDKDEKNHHVVSAMQILFAKFPRNTNVDEVYAKIAALDNLYNTQSRKLYDAAQHIVTIPDLDQRLEAGDLTVVNEIARVPAIDKHGQEKIYHYYSLATKFCMFSNPVAYSIYDYYVEKVLKEFNKIDQFFDPRALDFRNYEDFDQILRSFREKYHDALNGVSRLDMDRYLWLLGKKTFPRYSKN